MRRERLAIARDVASQLWEAERKNDQAMASTARLIAAALDARLEMRAGACIGQAAVEAMAAAIAQQASSRKMLIEAHEALNEAKDAMGLAEHNFGGGGDKRVPEPTGVFELPMRRAA
jgi:hypothetical protein